MARVVRSKTHDWSVAFVVPAVRRTWNGHDISHMATRRYGASSGQDGYACSKEQGWALQITVSRKDVLKVHEPVRKI